MNQELLSKARAAKTPEELLQLAHENGMEYFTEENAKAYFDILNNGGDKKSGELSDEELDSTTGGACVMRDAHGKKMVAVFNSCSHFVCDYCNKEKEKPRVNWAPRSVYLPEEQLSPCRKAETDPQGLYYHSKYCNNCYYCSYEDMHWACNCDAHKYE